MQKTPAICHLFENLLPAASYSRRVSDLKVPIAKSGKTLRGQTKRSAMTRRGVELKEKRLAW